MIFDIICPFCKARLKGDYPELLLPAHGPSPDTDCVGVGIAGLPVALIHGFIQ